MSHLYVGALRVVRTVTLFAPPATPPIFVTLSHKIDAQDKSKFLRVHTPTSCVYTRSAPCRGSSTGGASTPRPASPPGEVAGHAALEPCSHCGELECPHRGPRAPRSHSGEQCPRTAAAFARHRDPYTRRGRCQRGKLLPLLWFAVEPRGGRWRAGHGHVIEVKGAGVGKLFDGWSTARETNWSCQWLKHAGHCNVKAFYFDSFKKSQLAEFSIYNKHLLFLDLKKELFCYIVMYRNMHGSIPNNEIK